MNYIEIAKLTGDEPFRAQQKWTELAELLELLDKKKPKNILEIGTYKGGTLMAWTHIADKNAKIIGVDLPGGDFGGGFTDEESKDIINLKKYNQQIFLFAMDSHEMSTIDVVKNHAKFDFCFIDGDHTYEGVKKDYENYLPLMKKGGTMAFHDVAKMSEITHPGVQVYDFWQEIKDNHEHKEIIDLDFETDHGIWGGIGILFL